MKFRAKAKFNGNNVFAGDWVHGSLIVNLDPHTVEPVISEAWIREPLRNIGSNIEIDVDTIGKASGSLDKMGNEIYEGDIIKSGMTGGLYVIRFGEFTTKNSSGIGFWKQGLNVNDRGWFEDSNDFVKSNIHDNPKYLESN